MRSSQPCTTIGFDSGQAHQPVSVGWMRGLFAWAVIAWLLCAATVVSSQVAVSVTRVSTPQQLKAAIDGGASHVHITNHLDLTALPSPPNYPVLFRVGDSLQSVTVGFNAVNCQCVLPVC
jgi:hypothetical protein